MILNRLFKTLLALALIGTFASCQDHQIRIGTQRFRLKKSINAPTSGNTSENVYNYNQAGKLITIDHNTGSSTFDWTDILRYDSQGRLIEKEKKTAAGLVTERTTYAYNANSTLSRIQFFYNPNQMGTLQLWSTANLEYGTGPLPGKITTTGDSIPTTVALYTYANGNIAQIDYPLQPPGDPSRSETFTYDDKPNPFYGLLGGESLFQTANKNNALYNTEQLEYENGLLVRRLIPRFSGRVLYEYEAY